MPRTDGAVTLQPACEQQYSSTNLGSFQAIRTNLPLQAQLFPAGERCDACNIRSKATQLALVGNGHRIVAMHRQTKRFAH